MVVLSVALVLFVMLDADTHAAIDAALASSLDAVTSKLLAATGGGEVTDGMSVTEAINGCCDEEDQLAKVPGQTGVSICINI